MFGSVALTWRVSVQISSTRSADLLCGQCPFMDMANAYPQGITWSRLIKKVDAWGVPVLKIHASWSANERALLKDMSISAAEMLAAAGARDIHPFVADNPPGLTVHEMGTARMGRDPKTSVLNAYNQAHDVKNLFVTDGACMASSSCVNPSLTYMALTARSCHYAVERMKRGEL